MGVDKKGHKGIFERMKKDSLSRLGVVVTYIVIDMDIDMDTDKDRNRE